MAMHSDSYKLAKEAFVAGLEGTTLWEVSFVTATAATGYLLRSLLIVCLPLIQQLKYRSALFSFLLDFTAVILPGVLVFTVLADYCSHVLALMLTLSLAIVLFGLWRKPNDSPSFAEGLKLLYPRKLPFVSLFRTDVILCTAIAILAVDFPIFPRRLAKAETYGSGLMDVGVGTFLLAHGIVAPEARYPDRFQKSPGLQSYVKMLVLTGRSVLPLFVLGLLRLAVVKVTGYQEHVTEYGLHWNFFFTIAVVRMLCTAIHPLIHLIPRCPYGLLSLAVAILYQCFLSRWGGREYIMLGPHGDGSRPTLLSANREGVISCVGYLAVYTGNIQVGRWLFGGRSVLRDHLPLLLQLIVSDVILWVLTVFADAYVEQISRRFVNLAYILWIFAYGFMVMVIFLAVDCVVLPLSHMLRAPLPSPLYSESSEKKRDSLSQESSQNFSVCVVSAMDYNQLFFFVVANIFTGFVNVAVDTLHASALVSLVILVAYMAALTGVFVLLHWLRIKIKL